MMTSNKEIVFSREDVIFCYRYFLGRKPECEDVIDEKIRMVHSVQKLIECFIQSEEYTHILQNNSCQLPFHGKTSILKKYSDGVSLTDFSWVVPIVAGKEIDSIKMGVINNDKSLTNEVYEIEKIISIIIGKKEKKGFLDLGANIGKFIFPFSKMGGWLCYAVEAADDNYEGLLETCKLNDLRITILNNIIYDHSGDMYFYANGPYGMCAKNKQGLLHKQLFEDTEPIALKSICLNDWKRTELNNMECLDFIKMDVEGSEVATIRGADKFLEFFNYPSVFCESNKWTLYTQGETPDSLRRVFSDLGYDQYIIKDDRLYLVDEKYYQIECNTDYLFIHSSKYVDHDIIRQTEKEIIDGIIEGLNSTNELEVLGNYYGLVCRNQYLENNDISSICQKLRDEKKGTPIWEYALLV